MFSFLLLRIHYHVTVADSSATFLSKETSGV